LYTVKVVGGYNLFVSESIEIHRIVWLITVQSLAAVLLVSASG